MTIDDLFADQPDLWIKDLPAFQRSSIAQLMADGRTYEDVAQAWLTASANNTYKFSAGSPVGDKNSFLKSVKAELRAFLCGDKKYKTEREGLWGERSPARTLVVSSIAVAIAPHINVAAAVLAPVIAVLLASLGKITLNAWCAAE